MRKTLMLASVLTCLAAINGSAQEPATKNANGAAATPTSAAPAIVITATSTPASEAVS